MVPSAELDAHLHTKAAEIAESRHNKLRYSSSLILCFVNLCVYIYSNVVHCVCDNRMLQESPTSGIYGNDLMTPPEVLLEGVRKEAEKVTKEKSVVTRSNKINFINIFSTLLTSVGCHSNYCLLHCL